MDLSYLRLRPAKTEEISPEAMLAVLGSFIPVGKRKTVDYLLWRTPVILSLEYWSIGQKTYMYMVTTKGLGKFFTSQMVSHYPKILIEETTDPIGGIDKSTGFPASGVLKMQSYFAYPIKTFKQQTSGPLISSILGILAKTPDERLNGVQIVLRAANQKSLIGQIQKSTMVKNAEGNEVRGPDASLYETKIAHPLLEAQIRLFASSPSVVESKNNILELAGAFGGYTLPEGNGLLYKAKAIIAKDIISRNFKNFQPKVILNLEETASLWHLPDMSLAHIKNLDWGRTLISEAPDNLPVTEKLTEEQKGTINFFGNTEWRNREVNFGLKDDDRRKHVYIMGKTGAGKSTLIANMAINDIRNGKGVAVIDPHGDLSEMILKFIPKRRVNDVIYLDPTLDEEKSFSLNLFDSEVAEHTDLVASGIISVFYKLYHDSWGPRLEYILRNSIISLLYCPGSTFVDLISILTQKDYRNKVLAMIGDRDPVITAFWRDEFEHMNEKLRVEAISPILNKVGQFLSSQRIRRVVGNPHSTVSIKEVMDQGKILIVNLAQGKLGEDTTALLGAMFITKMQLTAMQRVNIPEEQRRDFYLYVDEFQNFATSSFINILSEARKYRLNLIMANQYIDQVDETIQKAIFGNVGTLITFLVGAKDAAALIKEFGEKFTAEELVGLGKYKIIMKMCVEGITGDPFFATTLPLPAVINNNHDKIVQVSKERYYH
jgi:hypothetical protein